MRLVEDLSEILANLVWMDTVRRNFSNHSHEREQYRSYVRLGTCFVAYQSEDGIAFAPSRLIGYARNSFSQHANNDEKHGQHTNNRISLVFGENPISSNELDQEYRDFCVKIGVSPRLTGNFGRLRRFWDIRNFPDLIDLGMEKRILDDPSLPATEKTQLVQARRGQGKFRSDLMSKWGGRCCITGCGIESVLRASHIKPWAASNNAERLDPNNGLLLSAHLDALFDHGLVSFDEAGRLLISLRVNENELQKLGTDLADARIKMTAESGHYLDYHRGKLFLR